MKTIKFADRHPVAVLGTTVVAFVVLYIWSRLDSTPMLLASAGPAHRLDVYNQFASSAVAMLAVTLTVLAILLALPDRPALEDLRASDAWSRVQATLLAAALHCLVTLVSAHLGTAIDDRRAGNPWISLLMLSAGAMAVIAVLIGGIVFALFLRVSSYL
jgi:hypothetical protein